MSSWMSRPWIPFDTETTGVDPDRDLILSIALLKLNPMNGRVIGQEYLLLNWDVDIPEESAKIHGLTRQHLAEHGMNPLDALEEVCVALATALRVDVHPIVGMNVVFDLTMLERNCLRHGITPLSERTIVNPVVDVQVLDKIVDPYRKGKRNLTALAEHYHVPWGGEGAHNAMADARVAAGVAWRIGRAWPNLGAMDPVVLHELQAAEKKTQDASFRKYLLEKGRDASDVDGQWPIRKAVTQ